MIEDGDRTSKEYWNKRVLNSKEDGLLSLVYASGNAIKNEQVIRKVLEGFKNMTVVDVACGYGRFCDAFNPDQYYGFDFSEEMIKMAKELYPSYKFEVQDARTFEIPEADIVMEHISLGMLQMSRQQFFDKYKNKARVAVICSDSTGVEVFINYDWNH